MENFFRRIFYFYNKKFNKWGEFTEIIDRFWQKENFCNETKSFHPSKEDSL